MKYTLHDVRKIIDSGFDANISIEQLDNLKRLILTSGVICTVRIPTFLPKLEPTSHTASYQNRPGKGPEKSNNEQVLDTVRLNLNKLTSKTWDSIFSKVATVLDSMTDCDNHPPLMALIFSILSSNSFNSVVYSKMYVQLVQKYPWVNGNFEEQCAIYVKGFYELKCISPNDDYDGFCAFNKENEKRKAISTFLVNLVESGYYKAAQIYQIAVHLMEEVVKLSVQPGKSEIIDIISDNIVLLHKNTILHRLESLTLILVNNEKTVLECITEFATTKLKTYASISSKTKFLYMKAIGI